MVAFAAQEQSVGAAIMAGLANARLVPAGGVAVPCVFSRPVADSSIGTAGMASRGALVSCLAADVGEDLQRDSLLRVYWDDQLVRPAGQYRVRDRDDDLEAGMARLDLELVAA
jgi:hypothetical protein